MSYFQPANTNPPAGPPPVEQGPRNPLPNQYSGAYDQNAYNQMQNMLPFFQAGLGQLGNKYMDNMNRGQFLDMPSFDELYNSYRTVGEREANRQAGNITAGLSGRGAGYSSDVLNSQGDVRKQLFEDLANKAAQYQQSLRGQQYGEVYGMTGLEQAQRENALNRMFGQFQQQSQLPPMMRPQSTTEPTYIVR